jgi:hypothetical protein
MFLHQMALFCFKIANILQFFGENISKIFRLIPYSNVVQAGVKNVE